MYAISNAELVKGHLSHKFMQISLPGCNYAVIILDIVVTVIIIAAWKLCTYTHPLRTPPILITCGQRGAQMKSSLSHLTTIGNVSAFV